MSWQHRKLFLMVSVNFHLVPDIKAGFSSCFGCSTVALVLNLGASEPVEQLK